MANSPVEGRGSFDTFPGVSRPTIYKALERAGKQEFVPLKSVNNRFKSLKFGLKRLSKIERNLEEKLNKDTPMLAAGMLYLSPMAFEKRWYFKKAA